MLKNIKCILSILGRINIDTHLWCLGVLCGAVLLCVSFFVEPTQRSLVVNDGNDVQNIASRKVIEYSSVLGSLSGIEMLEDDQVEEIVDAIPDIKEIEEVIPSIEEEISDISSEDEEKTEETLVASCDNDVDLSKTFSLDEIDALERLVQCEAASEDLGGRTLVANVVLNRVDKGTWGDDILSVIESPGQFEPVVNGAVKITEVDALTRKAVIEAMAGDDVSMGAMYFRKSPAPIWGEKEYLFRYGSHSFYK